MKYCFFAFVLFVFCGCNINSYIMLKDTEDTEFSAPPVNLHKEYKISVFDQINFRFYKNNGFEILGGTNSTAEGTSASLLGNTAANNYTVEQDGNVKLPLLGKVEIAGLTIREAEAKLEMLYDSIYVEPFILLNVTSRRVIVSKGNGSSQVVPLNNQDVTVLEALSLAGGIDTRGKANSIKVIRRVNGGHEIYKMDLSTLDGLDMAEMVVQSNDIIYVEPRNTYSSELIKEIAPYLSIISSAILILTATRNFSN